MNELFRQSLFAGATISLIAYEIGLFLKKKFGWAILNPLLVSIVIVIIALKGLGISYEVYNASAKYISYLLTPATVCLAVPLYEQLELLKEYGCSCLYLIRYFGKLNWNFYSLYVVWI